MQHLLLIGLSAVLYTLAFPDAAQFYLAWVALVPLLYVIWKCQPRRAFLLGWLAGILYATGISYWVYGAMTKFSATHPAVALLFQVLVVGGWMGLYYGLFAAALSWMRQKQMPDTLSILSAAALWVVVEYLRGNFLLAMPWAQLGHSQASWLPMAQLAEVFGVYGLSFLIATGNAGLLVAATRYREKAAWRLPAAITIAAFVIPMLYGVLRLATLPDAKKKVQVGIVQPSVLQSRRWKKEQYLPQLEEGLALSQRPIANGAKLLVWPETAIQFYLQEKFPEQLRTFLTTHRAEILVGAPRYRGRPGAYRFFNSTMLVSEEGVRQYYDKMHLLPFGEYFPWKAIDFLSERYASPREYEPGQKATPIVSQGVNIGSLVCFEVIFPSVLARHVQAGAQVLANLSNEAWFSRGSMAEQHLQMAQLSAISFRRAIVRSANTGVSALVEASGAVSARIELFEKGARTVQAMARSQRTLYSLWGDVFVLLCFGFVAWCGWRRR